MRVGALKKKSDLKTLWLGLERLSGRARKSSKARLVIQSAHAVRLHSAKMSCIARLPAVAGAAFTAEREREIFSNTKQL